MATKLFYSMGEVSEMFDVNPSLLRHWETKFDVLKPRKNKKGNRMYSPADVEHLKLIYHLVKERGMTLDGASRALKSGGRGVARDMELLERLQRIRAQLLEVRNELKGEEGDGTILVDGGASEAGFGSGPVGDVLSDSEAFSSDGDAGAFDPEVTCSPESAGRCGAAGAADSGNPAAGPDFSDPSFSGKPGAGTVPESALDAVPEADREAVAPYPSDSDPDPAFGLFAASDERTAPDHSVPGTVAASVSQPGRRRAARRPVQDVLPGMDGSGETADSGAESDAQSGVPQPSARRARRRKDDDDKELFAFYEQSLF